MPFMEKHSNARAMEVTGLLTTLSFLLLCFTAKHRPSLANAAPAAVLDSSGKELQKGVHYHIMPAIRGSGGGIGMAVTRQSKRCPLDIIQKELDGTSGIPLTFWPVNPNDTVVRLSTDLNIKFPGVTLCFQSTVWKLDSYDPLLGHWFVTTNGVMGSPGPGTIDNWFKIEKHSDDYKLVLCPTVCSFCQFLCQDVGIVTVGSKRALALSNEPYLIMFERASVD